jgi:hypothetical protein
MRPVLNYVEMEQLLKQGKSSSEVGVVLGCTGAAVRRAHSILKKRMEIMPDLVKQSELQKDNLDTISQLGSINRTVMDELDRAKRLILREDMAVKEREDLEDRVKEDPTNTVLVAQLKEKSGISFANILKIQSNVIDISAEVRKQLELQIKIAETLYNATMMAQFQEEVLNAIGRASLPVRESIIKELKQLRTLRGLVQVKK